MRTLALSPFWRLQQLASLVVMQWSSFVALVADASSAVKNGYVIDQKQHLHSLASPTRRILLKHAQHDAHALRGCP